MSTWLALAIGVAFVAGANLLTTRCLWQSSLFERSQKIGQTVLVWLVPGAFLVVRHFLPEPRYRRDDDPTVGPAGINSAVQASHSHCDGDPGGSA